MSDEEFECDLCCHQFNVEQGVKVEGETWLCNSCNHALASEDEYDQQQRDRWQGEL